MKSYKNVSEYISHFPKDVQPILKKMRVVIKKAAPQATEKISYGIPTYYLNGNLIHFGAFKDHISIFPGSYAILKFKKELSEYKTSKGTIQFPLEKPIPYGLIGKITRLRVKESQKK